MTALHFFWAVSLPYLQKSTDFGVSKTLESILLSAISLNGASFSLILYFTLSLLVPLSQIPFPLQFSSTVTKLKSDWLRSIGWFSALLLFSPIVRYNSPMGYIFLSLLFVFQDSRGFVVLLIFGTFETIFSSAAF